MVPPTAVAEANAVATKDPVKDTILTPRFYTTDFDAMAAMDLRPNEAELEAICEEFRKDYNRQPRQIQFRIIYRGTYGWDQLQIEILTTVICRLNGVASGTLGPERWAIWAATSLKHLT